MTKIAYGNQYVDLHLHLDGAVTVEIAKELANLQGITLPADSDEELEKLLLVPADCQSLNEFLQCFDLPLSLMQTPVGLREAVRRIGNHVASQGVIYAEIRFAPQHHTHRGMTQEDAVLAALEGLKALESPEGPEAPRRTEESEAPRQTEKPGRSGLKANLILCCMRGEGNDAANEETLELTRKYLVEDGGVVALDLAGAEALYPTENYRDLFTRARDAGIPFTIHAGEAAGADSVRAAIEFGAARIGHGVRAGEDDAVLQLLKERGIVLEMCPTSNRMTHAVEDMSAYPLMDYLERGLKVTINTDDPGIEGIVLADEFRYMENTFGLTAAQEQVLVSNAVDAAFTTDAVRDRLRTQLDLQEYKKRLLQ